METISFAEALKRLNIEDYGERIFHSNSHGELIHILDYILFATVLDGQDASWFRGWFEVMVKMAEENWKRPESVFQHIPQLFKESVGLTQRNKEG
jgi:hypothetical protein